LVGSHSNLIGGYHAVFVLLQPAFALGVWQLVRLWRFRHVPMREALPSPFGLRLGHGRVAAALVFLCQFFCLWLPAIHITTIFFDSCVSWLRPADPAWRAGLAVVCWKDESIVSPWLYPETGRGFWLQDRFGPPGHPLSRKIDQIGFTPLLFPLIMAVSAITLLAALVGTAWFAARSWWLRRHRLAALLPCLAIMGTAALFAKPASAFFNPPSPAVVMRKKGNSWISAQMTEHVRQLAVCLLGAEEIQNRPSVSHWTDHYAHSVNYRNHGTIPRSEIKQLWQQDLLRADRIEVSILSVTSRWNPKTGNFSLTAYAMETFDGLQPAATTGANECALSLTGNIARSGHTVIHQEEFRRRPLYHSLPRHSSLEEAVAWTQSLQQAVRLAATSPETSKPALDALFHPLTFSIQPRDKSWLHTTPAPDGGLMALLKNQVPAIRPQDVSISNMLPGGRTRVRLRLRHSPTAVPRWMTVDLIHHAGTLKCVRLAI
jgi:hypothetical protein